MEMERRASGLSDQGKRENNEDRFLLFNHERMGRYLFIGAVADGAGAHSAGEVASENTVRLLNEWISERHLDIYDMPTDDLKNEMYDKILDIHQELKKIRAEKKIDKFGTTLTLFLLLDNRYIIAQVGDSRAYIYNEGKRIKQITRDQTKAQQEREKQAFLYGEELKEKESIILQGLGYGSVVPQIYEGILPEQYVILLCSDGLSNKLLCEDFEKAIAKKDDGACMKEILKFMMDEAIRKGESDNMTGILYCRQSHQTN